MSGHGMPTAEIEMKAAAETKSERKNPLLHRDDGAAVTVDVPQDARAHKGATLIQKTYRKGTA